MPFFVEICPILAKMFKNFQLQDFFCDYIHGLHFCDNFGVFNINIEDFIGKNSEKSPKMSPLFPKSQSPENLIGCISERG